MASILRDSFDSYNGIGTINGLAVKWYNLNGPDLRTGRLGSGQALGLYSSDRRAQANFSSGVTSFTLHCGLFNASATAHGTAGRTFIFKDASDIDHLGVCIAFDGGISIYRNTTEIGSRAAAGSVPISQWCSLAIEVVMSDTVGRCTIYVDGVQVMNQTGLDNINTGTGTIDRVLIRTNGSGGNSSTGFTVDDLYVIDSATKLANHPRIVCLVPDGDGATLNWVPSTGVSHFAVVDEALATTTDYLSGSVVGDVDELTLTALGFTPASIEEVCMVGYAVKTDVTARSIALGVDSGGTVSDGANFALTTTGGRLERPMPTDPNTAAAWTAAAIAALKARPKVTV